MFGLGTPEIIIILIIVLLLFGGKKLPELAKGLGKGLREFKNAKDNLTDTLEKEADDIAAEKQATKNNSNPDLGK